MACVTCVEPGTRIVAKRASKGHPAASDTRPHGARRNPQNTGYFGVVQVTDIAQHDRYPKFLGECGEGGLEPETISQRVICGRAVPVDVKSFKFGEANRRSPFAASEFIETGIGSNPVEPGGDGRSTIEAGETANDGKQGFLGRVGRVGVVAGDASTDRKDTIEMDAQKGVHGALVPALCGGQKKVGIVAVDGQRLLSGSLHDAHL